MTIRVAFVKIIPLVICKDLKSTKKYETLYLPVYHSASHFMTDTRSKTKANSIVTLNRHRRGSGPTNETIVINDDTNSDMQTLNTAEVDTIAKNSLMSPWKDEMMLRSDFSSNDTEEDSDVLPRTPVRPIITKKSMTTGRIARKNSINKGTPIIERSNQRSNPNQRIKTSTVGKKKPQRYHWSGTFRTKISPKNINCSTYYSSRGDKLHDTANTQLMNYNYYCEDFAKKSTNKKDIFYSNKFDPQAIDTSWKEWIDDSIDRHPCIDICTDNFERCNNFKDYDADRDNGASPAIFSDININLKQRKIMDNKNKDSRMNNSVILYSQREHDVDNVNEEDDNLFNVKKLVDPTINIKSNIRKITTEKSAIQLDCYKICCSMLSFMKNFILFSLLPTAYIIFFIYVQEKEDKKTG